MTRNSTVLAGTDRAVSDLSGLSDADLAEALTRALLSRPSLNTPARDELLALIQLNLSAPTVMAGIQHAAWDRHAALSPIAGAASGAQTSRLLRIEGEARAAVLTHPMLTAADVAQQVNASSRNVRDAASLLRRQSRIVGVAQGNRYVYPAFQFDHRTGIVRPIVAEINMLLGSAEDPWGVASWWLTPADRLTDGRSPADEAAVGHDETVRLLAADILDSD